MPPLLSGEMTWLKPSSSPGAQDSLVAGASSSCCVEAIVVRTTVRSLAKEAAVRAAVASAAVATEPLTVVAADLTKDDGWDAAMTGCDYVLHVASPLGADGAGDRRVARHSGPGRHAARARCGDEGRRQARGDDVRRDHRDTAAGARDLQHERRDRLVRPGRARRRRVSPVEAARGARRVGLHEAPRRAHDVDHHPAWCRAGSCAHERTAPVPSK